MSVSLMGFPTSYILFDLCLKLSRHIILRDRTSSCCRCICTWSDFENSQLNHVKLLWMTNLRLQTLVITIIDEFIFFMCGQPISLLVSLTIFRQYDFFHYLNLWLCSFYVTISCMVALLRADAKEDQRTTKANFKLIIQNILTLLWYWTF